MRDRLPWPLLLAASLAMFTVAASGTTRAPFLIDMARDLSASVPLIANLVAITSVAWGITSIFAGAGSDRWGTRPFLIGGPLGLAVATVGVATGGSFLSVAVWGTIAGGFCGLFSGTVFTEVSSRVLPTQQGRALGWVMSGQSLTLLVGVPLAATVNIASEAASSRGQGRRSRMASWVIALLGRSVAVIRASSFKGSKG